MLIKAGRRVREVAPAAAAVNVLRKTGEAAGSTHDAAIYSLFEAIGEHDNRNRRWRLLHPIKIKLFGFDYVFARREISSWSRKPRNWTTFQAPWESITLLVGRGYRSKDSLSKTERYFVDKFPPFLSGAPSATHTVVCSCYIDGKSESHRL